MKRLFLLFVVICAFGASANRPLKLMSYNIRNAVGMDGKSDVGRVADVISSVMPDVVALQEVDSMTCRSGMKYVAGEIGRIAGMNVYYCPAIDFDGGKYGIALLSREPALSVRRVGLPGREEKRALLVVDFPAFTMACVHLSLTEADRVESLNIISDIADECDKPLFVAGDFNDTPQSDFFRVLTEKFMPLTDVSMCTYPADAPVETLDYVMLPRRFGDAVAVSGHGVIAEGMASDHRPVVVDVTLPAGRR